MTLLLLLLPSLLLLLLPLSRSSSPTATGTVDKGWDNRCSCLTGVVTGVRTGVEAGSWRDVGDAMAEEGPVTDPRGRCRPADDGRDGDCTADAGRGGGDGDGMGARAGDASGDDKVTLARLDTCGVGSCREKQQHTRTAQASGPMDGGE